jgi:hypothetical protein
MPYVDLKVITQKLFEDERNRRRICRDYGVDPNLAPEQAAKAMVDAFGQNPSTNLDGIGKQSNRVVFRAAARALASNSRSWATFIRFEPRLADLTSDYDPQPTAAGWRTGRLKIHEVAACLPGQTGSSDARAMMLWADMLDSTPNYWAELRRLEELLIAEDMGPAATVPSMAVVLGTPNSRMLRTFPPPGTLPTWKLPGMGPVLASEFLRNLRWAGFKPDRHIIRLFRKWFPDVIEKEAAHARAIGERLGTRRNDVLEFLTFSLVGAAVTPPDRSFTEVDNLVWALGAYAERKGTESSTQYRLD